MIFTLEALQAEQGDCFIVHFGADHAPQFLLVDGGPEDVTYSQVLAPRLGQLRARLAQGPLPLPLVVCSHIDDDHIGGVLDMFKAIDGWPNDLVAVNCLWHNSFTAILDEPDSGRLASVLARMPDIKRYASRATQQTWENNVTHDSDYMYAVSSVSQGDDLDRSAAHAGATINCGFTDAVVAPAAGVAQYGLSGLTLTVLGPTRRD